MTKTDRQIQNCVTAELSRDPSIEAAEIGVEVKNGVVTLAGHVGSYTEKLDAERAALRVPGVKALAMEMVVKISGSYIRTDADIATSVQGVLKWLSDLPTNNVKVKVEHGWITLTGKVKWEYQRQAAGDAIRHLSGVVGLSNEITISPEVTVRVVKTDIEVALGRLSTAKAQTISVVVNGNDVTLTGTVHSWSEREAARESVWSAPGVRNVVDNLVISH